MSNFSQKLYRSEQRADRLKVESKIEGQRINSKNVIPSCGTIDWFVSYEGLLAGDPWSIIYNSDSNQYTIRFNIEDSFNCGGLNDNIQSGSALAKIKVCERKLMDLTINGVAETAHENFENLSIFLDETKIAEAQSPGGTPTTNCIMAPVVKTFYLTPPYTLLPGRVYNLKIDFTTKDSFYHKDAFYEIKLSFSNLNDFSLIDDSLPTSLAFTSSLNLKNQFTYKRRNNISSKS